MAEYKCISCGEIKESEESCSCPVCGYKMFEIPYERDEVLRKEMGQNAILSAQRFTKDKIIPQWNRFFESLVANT